jgi:malate dehydrogenase (oxaloacetate-decarboxylating)
MLKEMGVTEIVGVDRSGAVHEGRGDLNEAKQAYAEGTNPHGETGGLSELMEGTDVFIGLSGPDVLDVDDLKRMARDPIVFAMANPRPEIMPEVAYPHVAVMATGRSDYPNQINNVLCFPGLFKGVLACRASTVNDEMKIAAAHAVADTIDERSLTPDYIVPSVFDQHVVEAVADAVRRAAHETGVARKE